MGAELFSITESGETVREAYKNAVDESAARNGHQDGYSGDIQTCSGYREVKLKDGDDVDDVYEAIGDDDSYDGKVFTKWENCAAVKSGPKEWTFIGWGAC